MIYEPIVITDSVKEVVSLAEFKLVQRLGSGTEQDALVSDIYLPAARRLFERLTGRAVHQKTLEWVLDGFPSGNSIKLPCSTPLVSISSFKYKESDGTETTWAASNYIADTDSIPGRLVLAYNISWPSVGSLYPVHPVRVRYAAGIATTSPVTEASAEIKQTITLLASALFEYREPDITLERVQSLVIPKFGLEPFIANLRVWL